MVEWSDYLPTGMVEEYLRVALWYGAGEERQIMLEAVGERYRRLLEEKLCRDDMRTG